MRRFLSGLIMILVISGCTAATSKEITISNNSYAPQTGDDAFNRDVAYVDSAEWVQNPAVAASNSILIKGSLPTSCHKLRIDLTTADKRLQFDVYSVVAKDVMCAQVLAPFEATVTLTNLNASDYTVEINGKQILP